MRTSGLVQIAVLYYYFYFWLVKRGCDIDQVHYKHLSFLFFIIIQTACWESVN